MAQASNSEKRNDIKMNQAPRPASAKFSTSSSRQAPRFGSVQAVWWQPAITMFLKLSVWIAAPVIIALYLGEWLDEKYQTRPWLFLACIGLAFIISIVGLVKNTLAEYKKIEKVGGGKEK